MDPSPSADLLSQCDLLRSLHRPGAPLLLPNAWDVHADEEGAPAGCNLEDTDHADGSLRDRGRQAEWLGAVRQATAALHRFTAGAHGPVNVACLPQMPALAELAAAGLIG